MDYQALEAAEIRLMILQPGRGNQRVCWQLVSTSLSERPEYEALSYEWGSPDVSVLGYMDGKPTNIRQNLWDALRHLRSPSAERVLWIDAICIDQNNIEERSHQVRLMGDIYSNASAVIIWLGLESDTSRIAMTWIRECTPQTRNSLGLPRQTLGRKSASQVIRDQVNRWTSLEELCTRSYWHRVWIVQEVVLARRLIIQCGSTEANWEGFSNIMTDYDTLFMPKSCFGAASHILESLPAQLHRLRRMDRHTCNGCTLLHLMEMTGDSQSSDPRDKVYGLLGLAWDGHDFREIADYSKSLLEMYQSLWHFFVASTSPGSYYPLIDYFQHILKNTPFATPTRFGKPESNLSVLGRPIGRVIFAGQPWSSGYNDWKWISTMRDLELRGYPMKVRFLTFKKAFGEEGLTLANPFTVEGSQIDAFSLSPTGSSFGKISNESYKDLDEEIDIQPMDLWNQCLIIGSEGHIAITMAETRVGDRLFQFRDREVTLVCRHLRDKAGDYQKLLCSALLPWRRHGGKISDASRGSVAVSVNVLEGSVEEYSTSALKTMEAEDWATNMRTNRIMQQSRSKHAALMDDEGD